MKPLRLVLVTERFWPLVGETEILISDLASGLQRYGARVTIVTAKWEKTWSDRVWFREVPVVRLPHRQRVCGTYWYTAALRQWLRRQQHDMDLAFVFRLKHDAYATIDALGHGTVPIVLRAEGIGTLGDCHWQSTQRSGARIQRFCRRADALVVPNEPTRRELCAAGYPCERIHQIACGVAMPAQRTAARRWMARQELAEAHDLLAVPRDVPLAVFAGAFDPAMGLRELVLAWRTVVARWPSAKLWLIGEGPYGPKLWKQIKRLDLVDQIILPGSFDDLVDVLLAADVFVLPCYDEISSPSLLQALGTGVPAVASDTLEHRQLSAGGKYMSLVPARDVLALSEALGQVLSNPKQAEQRAAAARQTVEQRQSLDRVVTEHLHLFERMIAEKSNALG